MKIVAAQLAVCLLTGCADTGGWFTASTKNQQEFPPISSSTAKTSPDEPSVAPTQPPPATPEVADSSKTSENSTPETELTQRVNDQVERLKKAYEQSQQTKKTDVTITSVTPVNDSDSLAAKLSQTPTPKPTPDKTKPIITPIKKPQDTPKPQAPANTDTKNVKILNIESVDPPKPASEKTPASTVVIADKPLISPPVDVPASDSEARPANQSIKLEIPNLDDPAVAMDQLLGKLEKKLQERPDDTATQVKLRLIYAVLGQWHQALKDNGGKDTTDGQLARDLVALIKVFDNPDLVPAQQANEALNLLDRLQDLLRKQADLKVSNMQLCREVVSFGSYKTMPPEYFVAGKSLPVIVYLELDNFTSKKLGQDNHQTLLSLTMEIVTESGKVCWRQHDDKIEDTANKQRRDFYIARLIHLPPALPAGKLGLKVTVEDLNGNKVAQRSLPFVLRSER